jgi:hypothetical protein
LAKKRNIKNNTIENQVMPFLIHNALSVNARNSSPYD